VLVFLAVAFTPLPNLLAGRLILPSQIEAAEAIVVLGGGIEGPRTLSQSSFRRTIEGIRLYRQGFAPVIIFSGGKAGQEAEEGTLMASLAAELGVPSTAIWVEAESEDTWAQGFKVAQLARPRGVGKILLVTDLFHMKRASAVFGRAGFRVLPAPVGAAAASAKKPEARLELMRQVCREAVARFYYRIRGQL
jgi:uncharacterized SAM-binding protein YcdF (DUF218 family)